MPRIGALVSKKPYTFVAPDEGRLWPRVLGFLAPSFLRKKYGVTEVEIRDINRLQTLIQSGNGILLTPNHCRMSDALVLQILSNRLKQPFFTMASSHVFRGSRWFAWVLRKIGAFSVNREGVDREAVKAAIDILAESKRPLVIFPEGALSQANDRLNALMEGVAFIASAAARKRSKRSVDGQVVTVPIAVKYVFKGDLRQAVEPMLIEMENRLSWRPQQKLSLVERIYKLGHSLLTLKEMEYLNTPQTGDLDERLGRLIDHLLSPMEAEWLDGKSQTSVISRVKELRKAVLPEMIDGELSDIERQRRWDQLEDMELAQQLSLYPPRYIASYPTVDRILETVERFSENLSGDESPHPPITAIVQVGQPIEVSPTRHRDPGGEDLLAKIETSLNEMLDTLSKESTLFEADDSNQHEDITQQADAT